MTITAADLGLLPDADVLRPSVWIGNTVKAGCQVRDEARRPVATGEPVRFLWKSPGNVVVETAGVPRAGKPGAFVSSYQPPMTGLWAYRVQVGDDGPLMDWALFEVVAEPPSGPIPQVAVWLSSPDTALLSMRGTHLAGATISGMPVIAPGEDGLLPPGLRLPAVDPDAVGGAASGQVAMQSLRDDMLAAVMPATEEVVGALSAAYFAAPGMPVEARRPASARGNDAVTALDFGLVPDDATDCAPLLMAAWAKLIAVGRPPELLFPQMPQPFYFHTQVIPPDGASMSAIGDKPARLRWRGLSNQLDVAGAAFRMARLDHIGPHSSNNYIFRIGASSTGAIFEDVAFDTWNSGILAEGQGFRISRPSFTRLRGTGIRVAGNAGGHWLVEDARGLNIRGFLCYASDSAHDGRFVRPVKRIDVAQMTSYQLQESAAAIALGRYGLECVGITQNVQRVHTHDFEAWHTNDGGISNTGSDCHIFGGYAEGVAASAVNASGQRVRVIGAKSHLCKRGMAAIPIAGGVPNDVEFIGCVATGSTEANLAILADGTTPWVAGQVYTGTPSYVVYQNRMYASPGLVQAGTIPPTHTSGTASDGINLLTFRAQGTPTLDAQNIRVIGGSYEQGPVPYRITTSGTVELIGTASPDDMIRAKAARVDVDAALAAKADAIPSLTRAALPYGAPRGPASLTDGENGQPVAWSDGVIYRYASGLPAHTVPRINQPPTLFLPGGLLRGRGVPGSAVEIDITALLPTLIPVGTGTIQQRPAFGGTGRPQASIEMRVTLLTLEPPRMGVVPAQTIASLLAVAGTGTSGLNLDLRFEPAP